jgi:hypothetical protein
VRDHDAVQGRLVDDQHVAILAGAAAGNRRAAGEQSDLAGEGAGVVGDQQLLAADGVAHDFDVAAQYDEHPDVTLALREQYLTGGIAAPPAEPHQVGELAFVEVREHLLAPPLEHRNRRLGRCGHTTRSSR